MFVCQTIAYRHTGKFCHWLPEAEFHICSHTLETLPLSSVVDLNNIAKFALESIKSLF